MSHRSDLVTRATPRRTMRATALSLAACGIALALHQGAAAVAADTPAKPAASADTGTAGDTSTITSLTPE
ncbi:MAG: hypothetical protein ACOYK7_15785, partial [Pirellulales bacterium]